jgi:hypothetical protein
MPYVIEFQPPAGVECERRFLLADSRDNARRALARELNLHTLPPPVADSPETYRVGLAEWTITAQ